MTYEDLNKIQTTPNPLIANPSAAPQRPPIPVEQIIPGGPSAVMGDYSTLGAPRSIAERMTNPAPEDMQAADGIKKLGRSHVKEIVGAFITFLSNNRDDVLVTDFHDDDGHGWVIKLVNAESAITTASSGGGADTETVESEDSAGGGAE